MDDQLAICSDVLQVRSKRVHFLVVLMGVSFLYLAEAYPAEELPLDDFVHGGAFVSDFHDIPVLDRPCYQEMKQFIIDEGLTSLRIVSLCPIFLAPVGERLYCNVWKSPAEYRCFFTVICSASRVACPFLICRRSSLWARGERLWIIHSLQSHVQQCMFIASAECRASCIRYSLADIL